MDYLNRKNAKTYMTVKLIKFKPHSRRARTIIGSWNVTAGMRAVVDVFFTFINVIAGLVVCSKFVASLTGTVIVADQVDTNV